MRRPRPFVDPAGDWTYYGQVHQNRTDLRYGNIETSVTGGRLYTQTATATGAADTATGVISINVPASEFPGPAADGKAVLLDVTEATSNIIVGSPERLPTPDGAPKQGFVYAADNLSNADYCDIILHEAQPQPSEEPPPAV